MTEPTESPAKKPLYRRGWFITVAVLVGLVVIGVIASGGGSDPTPTTLIAGGSTAATDEAATTDEVITTVSAASSTAAVEAATTVTLETTAGAATTDVTETTTTPPPPTTAVVSRTPAFGEGTMLIGEDVEPGTFETGGSDSGSVASCYWERLSGVSGEFEDIIANGNVQGHDVVEIAGSDVAFASDCSAWYTIEPLKKPLTEIPQGKWLLGPHIRPGTYETSASGCYWERLSGASGEFDDIIANGNVDGHDVVAINNSDVAFSTDCEVWTEVQPLRKKLTVIPPGKWIVGTQIVPGTYEAQGANCYWERLSGVSGEFGDIIANDNPTGRALVEIQDSDFAFASSGCGDWTSR